MKSLESLHVRIRQSRRIILGGRPQRAQADSLGGTDLHRASSHPLRASSTGPSTNTPISDPDGRFDGMHRTVMRMLDETTKDIIGDPDSQ